ncbi:TRAF3-interacting protein 1 [Cataglyphis hispanica]|uniref:TRAF3-interacting protein 1 n=1 Tax=Cataglyphis hispanica TaxID=1086592 RepID=UPI00217FB2CF|nr:TRAF3-interacting protein 1 [Cataglyphis hispanica]
MTDEVRPEVIKKTQDLLGKYFKKPPLTEKLLRKPPFRFLHDIITAVIKETGFLEGLFTDEELNSDNIKDKEAKLAFLTKLIDVVKLISGANLTVRASKIISGQEPTKTNELLQAIGKSLDKKVSSTEAIEHYKKSLQKKTKTESKSKSTIKEETSKKPAPRQASQTRKSSEKDKVSERKKRSSSTGKVVSSEAKNIDDKPNEKGRKENNKKEILKNVEAIDIPPAEPIEDKVPISAQKRRPSSSAKVKQNSIISATESTKEEQVQHRISSSKIRPSVQVSGSQEKIANIPSETSLHNEEQNKLETSNYNKETKKNGISEETKERQQSAGKSEQMPMSELDFQNQTSTETTVLQQSNARPKTSLRPPSARPISARPAAPRMRAKTDFIVNEEIQTPVGNISVIVENADLKDDDDAEDMVVMETKGSSGDNLENGDYKIDNHLMQEHGHLVAQILETQRELVNTDNVDVLPKKVDIAWESGSKRDREATTKEIDKLRGTIQTLTRATNPLGKLLDYVQEDVEMMQKELLDWRSQYHQLNEQLEKEEKETKEMIEPMKEILKEIDDNIKIQLDKIRQVKAQIMKNDQKIHRLLNGNL